LTGIGFSKVPSGFVPTQDKQYLVAFAQLPNGATLDRTEAVMRELSDIALAHPACRTPSSFRDFRLNGFTNSPNSGIVFVGLKPFEQRTTKNLSGMAITKQLNEKFSGIQEAFVAIFPPPPVQGLGTVGGFKLYVEDRAGLGLEPLYKETTAAIGKGYQTPALGGLFSSLT